MILVDFDGFRGISGVFGAAISRGDLSSILVNFVDFGQFRSTKSYEKDNQKG